MNFITLTEYSYEEVIKIDIKIDSIVAIQQEVEDHRNCRVYTEQQVFIVKEDRDDICEMIDAVIPTFNKVRKKRVPPPR